jgi:hypothetical protein
MRYPLALLLLMLAMGCSEKATENDRRRVLSMVETLRPAVEAALGDSLGEIEVTAVGDPEKRARVLASVRAFSRERIDREEFDRLWASGKTEFGLFTGLSDPAADVEGNLYFQKLPTDEEELARSTEAALVRSYQVRTLDFYRFLRDAPGEEERELRYRIALRHGRWVCGRLEKSRGAALPVIFPGAGASRPRCLANRTSRLALAELEAWDGRIARYLSERFPDLSLTEAFKAVRADPPASVEEVTGLPSASGPGYELAGRAAGALWPDLRVGIPARMLPEVIESQFLSAGK